MRVAWIQNVGEQWDFPPSTWKRPIQRHNKCDRRTNGGKINRVEAQNYHQATHDLINSDTLPRQHEKLYGHDV